MKHSIVMDHTLWTRLLRVAGQERRSPTEQARHILDQQLPPYLPEPAESEALPTREPWSEKYKREHPDEFPAPAFGRK